MASLNKCSFIGNLGRDPETRYFPNGDAVVNVTVACSETWKDKTTGEKKERTEWVPLVFTGGLAEVAGKYLAKGSQVYVEGKFTTRKWQDKEGADRYSTEVRVSELVMLGKPQGDARPQGGQASAPQQRQAAPAQQRQAAPARQQAIDDDSDIPF